MMLKDMIKRIFETFIHLQTIHLFYINIILPTLPIYYIYHFYLYIVPCVYLYCHLISTSIPLPTLYIPNQILHLPYIYLYSLLPHIYIYSTSTLHLPIPTSTLYIHLRNLHLLRYLIYTTTLHTSTLYLPVLYINLYFTPTSTLHLILSYRTSTYTYRYPTFTYSILNLGLRGGMCVFPPLTCLSMWSEK